MPVVTLANGKLQRVEGYTRLYQFQCQRWGTIFFYEHTSDYGARLGCDRCPSCGSKRVKMIGVYPSLQTFLDDQHALLKSLEKKKSDKPKKSRKKKHGHSVRTLDL